jgi:hypothetical protein
MNILLIGPEAPGLPRLAWLGETSAMGEIPGVTVAFLGGPQATLPGVAARLRAFHDVVIWSGHGGPNRLALADGLMVDGEWLACQLQGNPPRALVVAACFSGHHDESLQSLAEAASQVGISTVGMWVAVEDRAAGTYTVEFVRALAAGANVAVAHRVAGRMMADRFPAAAGAAFLLPGLTNGYSVINERLARVESRLTGLEGKLDWLGGLLAARG